MCHCGGSRWKTKVVRLSSGAGAALRDNVRSKVSYKELGTNNKVPYAVHTHSNWDVKAGRDDGRGVHLTISSWVHRQELSPVVPVPTARSTKASNGP